MKNAKHLLVLYMLVLCALFSHSQSYVGLTADNYSGVYGLDFNPSNVVDSKYKAESSLYPLAVLGQWHTYSGLVVIVSTAQTILGTTMPFSVDFTNLLSDGAQTTACSLI